MNFAKSAIVSVLISCFLFGGIAWRIHSRRHRGCCGCEGRCHAVVKIIPVQCTTGSCK